MADPTRLNPINRTGANPITPTGSQSASKSQSTGTTSFADELAKAQDLKFSNHAQKRLQTRDITLSDDSLARLATAVDKAEKRGGRESLVLMDDLAFIVNVKDRLVITAMDTNNNGEGVFTKIDSVVLADPSSSQKSTTDENGGNNESDTA